MKHEVSELEGALLDAAVAKAEGKWFEESIRAIVQHPGTWSPSMDWRFGGPIIQRDQISVESPDNLAAVGWRATVPGILLSPSEGGWDMAVRTGPTPLIAAMRAFVASKFGNEVELP